MTPPKNTATATRPEVRGSTQIECSAVSTVPPPIHFARDGKFHKGSFKTQDLPLSVDENKAAGAVPIHRASDFSFPAHSIDQIAVTAAVFAPLSPPSTVGNRCVCNSVHVEPPSSERCSLVP